MIFFFGGGELESGGGREIPVPLPQPLYETLVMVFKVNSPMQGIDHDEPEATEKVGILDTGYCMP